jgi:hypothetical protein
MMQQLMHRYRYFVSFVAANLELVGLNAYLTCNEQVPGLRVPLMAVIDYKYVMFAVPTQVINRN